MKNLWVLTVAMVVAGSFVACGGDDGKSCQISSDCPVGQVCQQDKCEKVICSGPGDCLVTETCVPGNWLPQNDAANKYCTAIQCTTDGTLACTGDKVCQDGFCVIGSTPTDVIETSGDAEADVDRETVEETGTTDNGTDTVTPPPDRVDCKSCNDASDCGTDTRWKCLPVGAAKHCLLECVDDGDCLPSYICYASSTVLKSCLPVAFNCVACSFDTPCEAGKVCNFQSGNCEDGAGLCQKCTYDYNCATGMRCFKTAGTATGACVPECSDAAPCADTTNFTCGVNEKGVQMCQPKDANQCGGCPTATPFPSPDGTACYECLNSSHCSDGKVCNTATHACEKSGDDCSEGLHKCADGNCHQCCEAADCAGLEDAVGTCTNYKCDGAVDACGNSCVSPYPICAVINGVAQCVQCSQDSDCAAIDPACTCTGDPTYTCLQSDGNVCAGSSCAAVCATDADCPPGSSGETLLCSGSVGGFCYNPNGTCDGSTACCPAGTTCFDMLSALMGGMGGMPGMGTGIPGSGMAACTCDDQHACLGSKPCTSTDGLCAIPMIGDLFCPGGVKPTTIPDKVCIDIMELLGGILGGI